MRPRHCVRIATVLAFVGLAVAISAATARGQAPEILEHYRLIPRLSVLRQTGGFAGLDDRYRLIGKFDLAQPREWAGDARIENAEVWGSVISPFPRTAEVTDIDELLNLEGLDGEKLAVAGPFDAYRFTGKIDDGSSIDIFAMQIGPWLGLRGFTTPPTGSADFFEYQLRAVARRGPVADFNDDGVVDRADLSAWATDGGSLLDGAPAPGADFLAWQQQLGEKPPLEALDAALSAAIASTTSSVTAVPEPAALPLATVAAVLSVARRMHRARRQYR
jgi:hypothetical protein